jgi:xylan 1,4-beta-xylosidase
MFGMMSGKRIAVDGNRMYDLKAFVDSSVRGQADIGGIAAKDKRSATIMVWNYHDADRQIPAEGITVNIAGLPVSAVTVKEYRIDSEYSNSYEVWKKMGSPQNPTAQQITVLEKAGQLETTGKEIKLQVINKIAIINTNLASQGIVLFKLNW